MSKGYRNTDLIKCEASKDPDSEGKSGMRNGRMEVDIAIIKEIILRLPNGIGWTNRLTNLRH